jgi:hypothetical protein
LGKEMAVKKGKGGRRQRRRASNWKIRGRMEEGRKKDYGKWKGQKEGGREVEGQQRR